jgi:hypothetical protein
VTPEQEVELEAEQEVELESSRQGREPAEQDNDLPDFDQESVASMVADGRSERPLPENDGRAGDSSAGDLHEVVCPRCGHHAANHDPERLPSHCPQVLDGGQRGALVESIPRDDG